MIHIDALKLYFGEPFQASDTISVMCPTIKEIVSFGEEDYFKVVQHITTIPSDIKSLLWDMKVDWETVSEFELFATMLAPSLPQSKTKLLLGDIDLSELKIYDHPRIDGEIILANKEKGILIDSYVYLKMAEYIRKMHGLKKKVERAKNKRTKMVLIEDDRNRRKLAAESQYKSSLYPLISSVKVRMGYTLDYVGQMHIVEFMQDLQRLQIIVQSDALLKGMYSGFVDTSKINKKELNWLRELE